MDIVEEIKFPTKDSDWIKKVLIGGILGLIPIINFIVYGYYLKVIKGAFEEKSTMPEWEDWGDLFIKGLIVLIISIVYMIIPIIVMLASAGGMMFAALSGDPTAAVGGLGAAIGGLLLGSILILIFGFVLPMGVVMYAKEDSIGAAFRIKEVLSRIKSVFGDYITTYIVLIVLIFVLSFIGSIPIIGWLIAIFGYFYLFVTIWNMFGKTYTRSTA